MAGSLISLTLDTLTQTDIFISDKIKEVLSMYGNVQFASCISRQDFQACKKYMATSLALHSLHAATNTNISLLKKVKNVAGNILRDSISAAICSTPFALYNYAVSAISRTIHF